MKESKIALKESQRVREAALELLLVSQLLQPRPVGVGVGEGQLGGAGRHHKHKAELLLAGCCS